MHHPATAVLLCLALSIDAQGNDEPQRTDLSQSVASPTILSAITSPASQPFDDVASTATVSLSKDTPVFTGVDPDMTTRSPFTGIDSDPTLTASAFGVGSVARTMNGTSAAPSKAAPTKPATESKNAAVLGKTHGNVLIGLGVAGVLGLV